MTISILPLTEHLKRNHTSMKVTILKKAYKFTVYHNNLLMILLVTTIAALYRAGDFIKYLLRVK